MTKIKHIRHRHVAAKISRDFKPGKKNEPGRRRWVNQENFARDIRGGWSPVFTKTGEIVSRPASNNKRAFMLEWRDLDYLADPNQWVLKDDTYIDSTAERVPETKVIEHDTKTRTE